jgi:uncharacterized protein YukE
MATTPVDILLRVRDEASLKLREVAAETGGLVGTVQRLTAGLGTWGAIAAGIGTIGLAAFAATSKVADMAEELKRTSAISSIGIEPLQAMFKIIRDAGGSTEMFGKALNHFKQQIADNNPLLAKLGIVSGTVEERFLKLAAIVGSSNNEFNVSKILLELLGKTGAELIPHMAALAAGTGSVQAAMRKTGEALDDLSVNKFEDLKKATHSLQSEWAGAWTKMATALAPTTTAVVNFMAELLKADDHINKITSKRPLPVWGSQWLLSAHQFPAEVPPAKNPADDPNLTAKEHKRRVTEEAALAREAFRQQRDKELADERKTFIEDTFKRNFIIPAAFGGGVLPLPGGPGRAVGQKPKDDPFKDVIDAWNKAAKGITDSVAVLNNTLDSVWTGLREGFQQVFQGILTGGQTFAQAMHTIFTSLAQSILSTLGELVAADVFKLFLKLVGMALGVPTGIPVPVAGTGLSGAAVISPSGPLSPAAGMFSRPPAGGGNTYIIQSFSPASVLQSLVSPTGPLRTAYDRLGEVAAAS